MRVPGGHDDALALAEQILLAVDGDAAHAVETGHEGVPAGLVRADLLTLIEGEKRHAQRGVLRELLSSDAEAFGGTGIRNAPEIRSEDVPFGALPCSARVTLPPLSTVYFTFTNR